MLVDWLAKEVTNDPRALEWFAESGADERIARAYRELLVGYEIDPATILKTTRMLERDEKPGLVEVRDIATVGPGPVDDCHSGIGITNSIQCGADVLA